MADFTRLKRKRLPMPADVRATLARGGLMTKYKQRPAYQQNDYLSWIERAAAGHAPETPRTDAERA